jgi:hypothetical protein
LSDLTGVNDTLPVRVGGVSSTSGLPDNYADVNAAGSMQVAGQGVAGTPAGGVVSIQGVASGTAVPVSQTAGPWTINLTQISGSALVLGQTTMSASVPVTIASNQSALAVSQSGTWTTGRTWTLASGTDSVSVVQSTSPWITKDQSDGPVTPGAVASFSQLIGGQYNSSLPTLTTGQQSAVQVDASGRLIISPSTSSSVVTVSNLPTTIDTNYGVVGASTLRTASQIGNATGSAAFGTGTTTAQVLRVVLATDQTSIPVVQSGTWTVQQGTPPWTIQGDSASGASKSGNPVQIGGVFNTTQPTVTTGQTVEIQSTARGAQIVATGVDNFNVNNISGTVSLPTGAATAANQATEITSLQSIDNPVGPVTPGTAGTSSYLVGAQYNSTLPTVSTGQQVALQVDSEGRLIISPTQISPLPSTGSGFSFGEITTTAITQVPVESTTYTETTTNSTMTLVSSSANDTAAGTGARSVSVTYLDQNMTGPSTVTVNLNGTTAVPVTGSMCYIEKMVVATVGSGASNAGTITLKTGGGATVGTIAIGVNRTLWAHHYTPQGKTSYISGFNIGTDGTYANQGGVFILKTTTPTVANTPSIQVSDFLSVGGITASDTRVYNSPIQIAGPARTTAYVTPGATSSYSSYASFDFIDN